MECSAEEIERRIRAFREMCRRRGLRMTVQRMAVFREVAGTAEHPDADAVLRRVKRRVPGIALDTVYRILYRLEDEGLISRVQMSSDRLRFDGRVEPHHHFVCSECGRVRDFASAEVDRLRLPAEALACGEIRARHLQVRGVCRECLDRRAGRKGR
jgi:Fur family peroxide stress response transcriptional regulator